MQQEIWFFQQGFYKVLITDPKIKRRLDFLKDVVLRDTYWNTEGRKGWGYTFPAKMYNKIAGLLKLPLKEKHPNRVRAGKQSKVSDGTKKYDLTKVQAHQKPQDVSKIEETSKDTIN